MVDDTSETSMITRFERKLPFGRVDADEFERRLKKLVDPESKDIITVKQLEESFKDHYAFRDVTVKGSLLEEIISNPILKKQ